MNKLFSFLCVSALLVTSAPALQAQRVTGNGNVVSKDRPASSFNEVHSKGSFDIVVTDGANHKVRVEAEENLQEFIEVNVNGNNLIIQGKKGVNFRATKPITVYVTAPALQAIKLKAPAAAT